MTQIGYLGVVIPSIDFWQGYFIVDDVQEAGRKLIQTMRSTEQLRNASQVIVEIDGTAEADQSMVGGLCAAVVGAAMGRHSQSVLATCGYALHELIGQRFFYIEGHIESKGTRTVIHILDVASIDEARDAINALPRVQEIKVRSLQSLQNRDESRLH